MVVLCYICHNNYFRHFISVQVLGMAWLGDAHPQVADGGTASNMEGSCEYIE
jgi:hypothetical protein